MLVFFVDRTHTFCLHALTCCMLNLYVFYRLYGIQDSCLPWNKRGQMLKQKRQMPHGPNYILVLDFEDPNSQYNS